MTQRMFLRRRWACGCLVVAALCAWLALRPERAAREQAVLAADVGRPRPTADADRSPGDLAVTADQRWLATANETSHTVSWIDLEHDRVLQEVSVGRRPTGIVFTPDEARLLVTCRYSGELYVLARSQQRLTVERIVPLGFEPRGVAVAPTGRTAYVALADAAQVAVVDLEQGEQIATIPAGRWPRTVALSPDGQRLAVGSDGDRAISILDVQERKLLFQQKYGGLAAGQMQVSADGKQVYFPWMIYRQNPIDARTIRLGWVLASRIARVRMDETALREAISLDPPGKAISDPWGLDITSDERRMVVSAGGTHELLFYRLTDLPFQSSGGPGDHIDGRLLGDADRFSRLDVGGRPMGLQIGADDRLAYVANYLLNQVQVVDIAARRLVRSIDVGGPAEPSLARQGEAIFYDGRRSLDQWYSCHTCHFEGETAPVPIDTHNDGTPRTFKTVLSLHNVGRTGPWTWHGWQNDLQASLRKSMTETMLGPDPSQEDVAALAAFLETMELPDNTRLQLPALASAIARGQEVFQSEKAGCAQCHAGPFFTDGKIHDVGLGSPRDAYQGFNTPSLLGVRRRVLLLHHGRAKSLEEALTDLHNPSQVTGKGELTEKERADLIAFLESL